jgi:glycine/D-amino acid oxidase-like deaminating enzyme
MSGLPVRTADVVVVGAGVQGASLAFHLAGRGAKVLVLERSVVGAGATGRSSGFVRMHYDLALEAELAWRSFPWFTEWRDRVGEGDPGFVRTGFLQLVGPPHAVALRGNVANQRRLGIDTTVVEPDGLGALLPGMTVDDVGAAAYEPQSGYADPTGTAAGLLAAARRRGASFAGGIEVLRVRVAGGRVVGVATRDGDVDAPIVVDAAGAWAAALARTAGVEVPVEPWRHDTAYFGLPASSPPSIPIVLDHVRAVYFRPEGRELLLVGVETGNEIGGSPDAPMPGHDPAVIEPMVERLTARVPWMADGDFRSANRGQDGMTPDQRAILGPAGPDGFFLDCGHSGSGFKTAPAIGQSLAEWILDGRPAAVDVRPFALDRFAAGRPLVGEHPYEALWR